MRTLIDPLGRPVGWGAAAGIDFSEAPEMQLILDHGDATQGADEVEATEVEADVLGLEV